MGDEHTEEEKGQDNKVVGKMCVLGGGEVKKVGVVGDITGNWRILCSYSWVANYLSGIRGAVLPACI